MTGIIDIVKITALVIVIIIIIIGTRGVCAGATIGYFTVPMFFRARPDPRGKMCRQSLDCSRLNERRIKGALEVAKGKDHGAQVEEHKDRSPKQVPVGFLFVIAGFAPGVVGRLVLFSLLSASGPLGISSPLLTVAAGVTIGFIPGARLVVRLTELQQHRKHDIPRRKLDVNDDRIVVRAQRTRHIRALTDNATRDGDAVRGGLGRRTGIPRQW
jgi:hypothetical protein